MPWAPSPLGDPMPSRTPRKSDRRKVSDRTMVGFAQPLCLSASGTDGRRYESTMNLRKREHHRVSLHYWGWTARPFPLCLTVAGEAFVLTSLFIERSLRDLARSNLGLTAVIEVWLLQCCVKTSTTRTHPGNPVHERGSALTELLGNLHVLQQSFRY